MTIKKLLAMTAALCMTTAVFASCGDTDESESETTTTTTTAAAEEEPAEESAAETETEGEGEAETEAEGEGETEAEPADDDGGVFDEYTGLMCYAPDEDYEPVTEFEGYDAFLMFADSEWLWSNFSGQGYPEANRADGAYGVDADITGDGEYTVSITNSSIAAEDPILGAYNPQVSQDPDTGVIWPATGATVFCVDITGICDGTTNAKGEALEKNQLTEGDNANVDKTIAGKYTGQDIKVTVTSIKADGEEVDFDESKLVYGNIEDSNNCYRIEIMNQYGDTAKDAPIDANSLMFAKSLEVTFTIEGLSE